MTDREKLTDEERERILESTPLAFPGAHYIGKMIRIIDAHEADRAALVKDRDEARARLAQTKDALGNLVKASDAEVTRLTAEHQQAIEDWRAAAEGQRDRGNALETEVARLTEALAAAEHQATRALASSDEEYTLRKAAEQKLAAAERSAADRRRQQVRDLENKLESVERKLAAAERDFGMLTQANESVTIALNAAEARVRELQDQGHRAETGRQKAVAELARANCLLLAAHPVVARSTDQGLRGAINHHLKQRPCGFDDLAGPGPVVAESEFAQLRARVAKAATVLRSGDPEETDAQRCSAALEVLVAR